MKRLQKEVLGITDRLKDVLPEPVYAETRDLIEANEWGVAFEGLCVQLHEDNVPISKQVYEELVRIGRSMDLDPSYWIDIQGQVTH